MHHKFSQNVDCDNLKLWNKLDPREIRCLVDDEYDEEHVFCTFNITFNYLDGEITLFFPINPFLLSLDIPAVLNLMKQSAEPVITSSLQRRSMCL